MTVAAEIKKLSDKLRAAKAASPSRLRRMIAPTVDEPVTRTRKRKPSVSSVIRQMKKAGVDVAGCEVQRDGTVRVISGKPGETTTTDNDNKNEWDTLQ
jgi:hypothetical protein